VMMPQLSEAFGLSAMGVASMAGLFYYGYSPFSLVAGVAMDRLGPRKVVPIGAAAVGVGALMFATGNTSIASAGRLLQGAGGVFALIGAAYIATTNFPASRAATLIGATHMFGMAGGSAGQFVVGPLMKHGVAWSQFWVGAGLVGLVLSVCLLLFLQKEQHREGSTGRTGWTSVIRSLKTVFLNPQSILCGLIAGLLFIPTTILAMTWGVRFLQEARDRGFDAAVTLAAAVPLGWMIGCPLLGFLSDRIGRRKPVIIGGAAGLLAVLGWVLYGDPGVLRGHVVGVLMGIVSGAAMLPYTVIKEANPPELAGSATGVINFINFTLSALLGPVFGSRLANASQRGEALSLEQYQSGFKPLLYGVALALVLACFLRETGPSIGKVRRGAASAPA